MKSTSYQPSAARSDELMHENARLLASRGYVTDMRVVYPTQCPFCGEDRNGRTCGRPECEVMADTERPLGNARRAGGRPGKTRCVVLFGSTDSSEMIAAQYTWKKFARRDMRLDELNGESFDFTLLYEGEPGGDLKFVEARGGKNGLRPARGPAA